jgi:cytochrome c peroxidase
VALKLFRTNAFIATSLLSIYCLSDSCTLPSERDPRLTAKPQYSALDSLGRQLFFDVRLSVNGTKSCASCHDPAFAFTDGYRRSSGLYGDPLRRNAPSLLNTRYLPVLTWADPGMRCYEVQLQAPLFNQHPPELGFSKPADLIPILTTLKADSMYQGLFDRAFPRQNAFLKPEHIYMALAAYEKTLVSFGSAFDRYSKDSVALPAAVSRGKDLFFDKNLGCADCHRPPLFTDGDFHRVMWRQQAESDQGLREKTDKTADAYRFRTPTLRNIMLTAPYFHDGQAGTLQAVFDVFEKQGHGSNPTPIRLNAQERLDLILFFECLTDSTVLSNTWFQY